jgi:hypothetical protein
VAVALVVVLVVIAMVSIGGGVFHPLVTHEPAALAAGAAAPAGQS